MHRRTFLRNAASSTAYCLAGPALARAADAGDAPNIIFIMTDDQGWTSVSYHSDPDVPESQSDYIETPRMAQAARDGMRFTDAYAPNPICAPTRHSLMFGQNAARHVYGKDLNWVRKTPNWLTVPRAIKAANPEYRTAHFGKWHIGVMPKELGFDFSDGLSSNAQGDTQNGKYKPTRDVAEKRRK